MRILGKPYEFEWDKGNSGKNEKHGIQDNQCEEAFFDEKKKIFKDSLHSGNEERFILLGKTKDERVLFIAFTLRGHKIRVISARKLNRREAFLYEEKT